MNDTPCSLAGHNCAGKFVQYIKNAKADVKLTLYVTSLCEAKEETCTKRDKRGRKLHPDCSKEDESAHNKGLKRLMEHCRVFAPSREAWKKLFDIMNMSENDQIIKEFWQPYESTDTGCRRFKNARIRRYLDTLRTSITAVF